MENQLNRLKEMAKKMNDMLLTQVDELTAKLKVLRPLNPTELIIIH
jgi:hypothetical protein